MNKRAIINPEREKKKWEFLEQKERKNKDEKKESFDAAELWCTMHEKLEEWISKLKM